MPGVERPTFQLSMTSRPANLLITVLVWAAIYLPALGSLEIKGEEGRRMLPGITRNKLRGNH